MKTATVNEQSKNIFEKRSSISKRRDNFFCQVPKVHEVYGSVLRKTSYYKSNRGQENGFDIFSGILQI